jgi:hypothetical protein
MFATISFVFRVLFVPEKITHVVQACHFLTEPFFLQESQFNETEAQYEDSNIPLPDERRTLRRGFGVSTYPLSKMFIATIS